MSGPFTDFRIGVAALAALSAAVGGLRSITAAAPSVHAFQSNPPPSLLASRALPLEVEPAAWCAASEDGEIMMG